MRVMWHFDKVSVKATRRWVDEEGKRRQETREFYQTVNPYNTMSDGTMKTRGQIMTEIIAQREAWLRGEQQAG